MRKWENGGHCRCLRRSIEARMSRLYYPEAVVFKLLFETGLDEKEHGDVNLIKKFQITKHKYQTIHNDQNSKFQTIGF
jgi:hypothetical protein